MSRLYTGAVTAGVARRIPADDRRTNAGAAHELAALAPPTPLVDRYPRLPVDGRDAELRRLLTEFYDEAWQRARDLQDPTWWQRHLAPHNPKGWTMNEDGYDAMLMGVRPEGCTCVMTDDVGRGPYGEPQEPAVWSLEPDCPVHNDVPEVTP